MKNSGKLYLDWILTCHNTTLITAASKRLLILVPVSGKGPTPDAIVSDPGHHQLGALVEGGSGKSDLVDGGSHSPSTRIYYVM